MSGQELQISERRAGVNPVIGIINGIIDRESNLGLYLRPDNFDEVGAALGNFIGRQKDGLFVEKPVDSCLEFWRNGQTIQGNYENLIPGLGGLTEVYSREYGATAFLRGSPNSSARCAVGGVDLLAQDVLFDPYRINALSNQGRRLLPDKYLLSPVVVLPKDASSGVLNAYKKLFNSFWDTSLSSLKRVCVEVEGISYYSFLNKQEEHTKPVRSTMGFLDWVKHFSNINSPGSRYIFSENAVSNSNFLWEMSLHQSRGVRRYSFSQITANAGGAKSVMVYREGMTPDGTRTEEGTNALKVVNLLMLIEHSLKTERISRLRGVADSTSEVYRNVMCELQKKGLKSNQLETLSRAVAVSMLTWLYAGIRQYSAYIDWAIRGTPFDLISETKR